MWFMKYIFNPIVIFILHSPFHTLLSRSVVLLNYRGKKSGKSYVVPVQYIQSDNQLYIIPGAPERKIWWRNMQGGSQVQITLRGKDQNAFAVVLTGGPDTEIIIPILEKYYQRYPAAAQVRKYHKQADDTYSQADLREAAQFTIVVQVTLEAQ